MPDITMSDLISRFEIITSTWQTMIHVIEAGTRMSTILDIFFLARDDGGLLPKKMMEDGVLASEG